MPRTELPFSSRGGDQRPIPITLGMTKIRAPLTPDFAGKPTYIEIILDEVYYIHLYIPRMQIRLNSYTCHK